MAANYRIGKEGALYYKPGGAAAGGAWTLNDDAMDVSPNFDKELADLSTRGTGGWKAQAGTLKNGEIEFEMLFNPSSAAFAAFRSAFMLDTVMGIRMQDAKDGDPTTPTRFEADMLVVNFTPKQPLKEGQTVTVKLVVAPGSTPTWT